MVDVEEERAREKSQREHQLAFCRHCTADLRTFSREGSQLLKYLWAGLRAQISGETRMMC